MAHVALRLLIATTGLWLDGHRMIVLAHAGDDAGDRTSRWCANGDGHGVATVASLMEEGDVTLLLGLR